MVERTSLVIAYPKETIRDMFQVSTDYRIYPFAGSLLP